MADKENIKPVTEREPSKHEVIADELEMNDLEKVLGGGLGGMPTDDPRPISDITRKGC
ncbi:MAG: hypothetical protein ABFC94_08780 [Syntrophomonas sp.]